MSAKNVERKSFEDILIELREKFSEMEKKRKTKCDKATASRVAYEQEQIARLRARKYDCWWLD